MSNFEEDICEFPEVNVGFFCHCERSEAILGGPAKKDGLLRRGVYHRAGRRPDPLAPPHDGLVPLNLFFAIGNPHAAPPTPLPPLTRQPLTPPLFPTRPPPP